jgi:Lon protease-like protein
MALEIPIFPLRTVLFPEGMLPLKIFEQRYVDMTKACIRDASPFGVCLLREGDEVGTPAVPYPVGCTALIHDWDMPHLGLFHLLCRGESVFRIAEHWAAKSGLLYGLVDLREEPPRLALAPAYRPLADLLDKIIAKVGTDNFPAPVRLDDADWVACRLAEVLPLDVEFKQRLLELRDGEARLEALRTLLHGRSIAV